MSVIPHSKPWITDADQEAIASVLRGGMLAQGDLTRRFEEEIAGWANAAGGVATGSGSAAIALALTALKVGPGDEVILPTYCCVAVMEAVLTTGAKPVLADVGPDWVMNATCAAPHVTPRTRAIIVPDMYGVIADVKAFHRLGVRLIEDWAQGVGRRGERKIEGDVAIFSFHPTKCLTAGEGGMAVSSNREIVSHMRELRDGRAGAACARLFSPLSDIASALGLSQLQRYPEMLARRGAIAERYRAALLSVVPDSLPARHLKTMFFRFPLTLPGGLEARQAAFLACGIHVRKGVDQLLHRLLGAGDSGYRQSVEHFDTVLSLPIYPSLTDADCSRIIDAAVKILSTR